MIPNIKKKNNKINIKLILSKKKDLEFVAKEYKKANII
jgi:hypothetical protein